MHNRFLENRKLVTTGMVFTISVLIAVLTILSIWLFGLGSRRTLFENSMFSTSLLSVAFFLFISIGLYRGIKLKDDIGEISIKPKFSRFPRIPQGFEHTPVFFEIGEGCFAGVLVWIITQGKRI